MEIPLADSVETLVRQGKYAKVPFIIGDMEDEGTLFALFQLNITKTSEIVDYFVKIYFPAVHKELISQWVDTYPDHLRQGPPYRTEYLYNFPQLNRIASMLGGLSLFHGASF